VAFGEIAAPQRYRAAMAAWRHYIIVDEIDAHCRPRWRRRRWSSISGCCKDNWREKYAEKQHCPARASAWPLERQPSKVVFVFEVKQADRPDFVTAPALANLRYDSHSSRRRITSALKLPTRTLREQHHRVPIWNCTGWRLPRFTVT